jgi:hypothetical protein
VAENEKYLPLRRSLMRSLRKQLGINLHVPHIGVTQGGSSRQWAGSRVAATDGRWRPEKVKVKKENV